MFGIPVCVTTTRRRIVIDVQVKKCVGVVSFVFKCVLQETLKEVPDTVSSVVDLFAYFINRGSDVSVVENEIAEEESPWDVARLTSKDDR